MKSKKRVLVVVVGAALVAFGMAQRRCAAQLHVLATLPAGESASLNGLTLGGGVLYGATYYGGVNGEGSVFALNTDGSNFRTLHSFGSMSDPVNSPLAPLTLSGSTLYGTATLTGGSHGGAVFSINTDGSGYHTILGFGPVGPNEPYAPVTLSGSNLYGATFGVSSESQPEIFSVGTNGNINWTTTLVQNANTGGLTLDGSTLFGTSDQGVFAINAADGSNYHIINGLTSFSAGSLLLSDNKMFGMTWGNPTVFSVNTDGSALQYVHSFSGAANDGTGPPVGGSATSNLVQLASTLIGITGGGPNNSGAVYSMQKDGSGYHLLYSFSGGPGAGPVGNIAIDPATQTLYGEWNMGGPSYATEIYSLVVPEPESFVLAAVAVTTLVLWLLVRAWWDDRGLAGRCPTCNRWIHFTMRQKRTIDEASAAALPQLPDNWASEALIV